MKWNQGIQIGQVATFGLLCSLMAAGEAEEYSFTKIADSSGTYSYSNIYPGLDTPWAGGNPGWDSSMLTWQAGPFQQEGLPALKGFASNNNGQVAFVADLKTGGSAIVVSDGITTTTIQTTGSEISSFEPGISLNEKGQVAFVANLVNGGKAIFSGDQNGVTPIAFSSDYGSFDPGVSMNDKGTVAFSAVSKNGEREIYTGNGLSVLQATHCDLAFQGAKCPVKPQRPAINNNGDIAYVSDKGVRMIDGKTGINENVNSDANNFLTDRFQDPDINNAGKVSYEGILTTYFNSAALNTSMPQPTVNNNFIAGNTDPLHSIARGASMNDGGLVAFMGEMWGPYGIFTGMPDIRNPKYGGDVNKAKADMLAHDKVIAIGDALDGSTVAKLSFDRENLNKTGQVTFWAELANKTKGIWRATPGPGEGQFNPLMPDWTEGKDGTLYHFVNQEGRSWQDPTPASGFNFSMVSDSLFTEIVNLPVGFKDPFVVAVEGVVLGQFGAGDRVNFSDFASKLGNLLVNGAGVTNFSVSGITTDASNPMTAFPIKLDFSTSVASFDMQAIASVLTDPSDPSNPLDPSNPSNPSDPSNPSEPSDTSDPSDSPGSSGPSAEVPEPSEILGSAIALGLLFMFKRKWKSWQGQKTQPELTHH